MTSSDELKEIKQRVRPCIACCCFQESCTVSACMSPPCMGTFKICCCAGSVACECCCISCEADPCWSQERGICEVAAKLCCLFSEVQCPPGRDIGIGCCGCGSPYTGDCALAIATLMS
jgi:hypothetical protein